MDNSVIEINDSIITVDSDADVEDGEVQEIDTDVVNIVKSTPPSSPQETNNQVQQ